MFKVSFSGLRERDVVSDLKKSLFCIWFQLVVVILCFATLLVSTGSALKKDEYEINIKHGTFVVHQRRANANSVTSNENGTQQQPNEQFLGEGRDRDGESSVDDKQVEVSRKNSQQQQQQQQPKPIKSIDFEAISPGLEEVPLQESIFQSSQGYGRVRNQGPTVSYQSVERYVNDDANEEVVAIVKPISAQDFYNTPQLRSTNGERGPVLFPIEQTTTTTTTTMATPTSSKAPSKRLKSIPKSAIPESEEIYLLLKYEAARKKASEMAGNSGMVTTSDATSSAGSQKTPQVEVESNGDFLKNGLRAGGSFSTVGYFVTDDPTTTMMTPGTMAASANMASDASPTEPSSARSRGRGRPNKLRNSYGDILNGDFRDFEKSFRPVTENTQEAASMDGAAAAGAAGESEDGGNREEIDANLDISEMTRILAGRSGGLSIQEFNRLFKDYLKKEITVDDLEEFVKYDAGEEPPENENEEVTTGAPLEQDPTKSFDIRAENGKKSTKTANGIATPAPTPKQQEQLKVQINKALAGKGFRKDNKVVKIGYGGSKSFQGVYKSQKFLEKVKSERAPILMDPKLWRGLEYRQQLPMREIGAMAYVDNPVFGFAGPRPQLAGPMRGQLEMKPLVGSLHGGQSYVKFQKIS
ncbi:uncharacterized protein LOC126576766 [Anopheles aquasalis]|uniref:uncharacterized protein LOC126576766 n=1 Tax=Anopheles aquasalis TaxID=42839 RepID=UPI00215A4228|nr:uncharacterized protein LOC126576766 [Anopheles aquasalis]